MVENKRRMENGMPPGSIPYLSNVTFWMSAFSYWRNSFTEGTRLL